MLRERGGENIDLRQSPAEAVEEEAVGPTIWKAAAKNETSRDMITPSARRSKMPGN